MGRSRRSACAAPAEELRSTGRVGLIGVPFDANSSFRRGPADAPRAIRTAMRSPAGNPFSERGVRVVAGAGHGTDRLQHDADPVPIDHGDIVVPQRAAASEPIDEIEYCVARALVHTPRLVVLGGDHAVTYPVVRAFAKARGGIGLLHFDAHPDMYPEFEGNRYSHASPMARILEDGLVGRLVQIGIRSVSPPQLAIARRYGVEVHHAYELGSVGSLEFERPLYVSIDVDALDPAFAPGVSHPEPGGLTVRQILDTLYTARAPEIVGGDVVELNPRLDPSGITTLVAAKLARELLARLADAAQSAGPRRRGARVHTRS
jgi:agmatinase